MLKIAKKAIFWYFFCASSKNPKKKEGSVITYTYEIAANGKRISITVNSANTVVSASKDLVQIKNGVYEAYNGEHEIGIVCIEDGKGTFIRNFGNGEGPNIDDNGARGQAILYNQLFWQVASEAEQLGQRILFIECVIGQLEGRPCSHGNIHTPPPDKTPKDLEAVVHDRISYETAEHTIHWLEALLEDGEEGVEEQDSLYDVGYDGIEEVRGHLARLKAIFSWQSKRKGCQVLDEE